MLIDDVLKLLEAASKYKIRELSYDGLKIVLDYQQNSIQSNFSEPNIGSISHYAQKFAAQDKVYADLKPEDILKPPAHLDKLSEEEILYAATPYFDELQVKKQMHEEKLKNDSV